MPPLIIAGAIAAGGSIAGGLIGSHAAGKAAQTQAQAAEESAQLQTQLGQEGLNLQTEEQNLAEQNAWPYMTSGYGAEANLDYLLGIPNNSTYSETAPQLSTPGIPGIAPGTGGQVPLSSMTQAPMTNNPMLNGVVQRINGGGGTAIPVRGTMQGPVGVGGTVAGNNQVPLKNLVNPNLGGFGSLSTPWTQQFVAPTDVTEQNDPGYKFRLQQGLGALQNSAAASGNLLTGQTEKDINDYAQNYASNEYGNVYNRALQQFQQSYNIFQNNQANMFNRLQALAGGGQTQAAQLNSLGQQNANATSNLLTNIGSQVGGDIQGAGAARASGYVGSANALSGGIQGLTGSLSDMILLNSLKNQNNNPTGAISV